MSGNRNQPSIRTLNYVFDTATGLWVPMEGSAGGAILVEGANTPADNFANPTNAVPVQAFLQVRDSAGTWDMARAGFVGTITNANVQIGFLNDIPTAQYNLGAIALADTEWRALQLTSQAWLRTCEQQAPTAEDNTNNVYWTQIRAIAASTGAWTNDAPTALIGTAGRNIKATPGRIRDFEVTNTGFNGWWAQVHNDAAAPVNTDNSVRRAWVPSGQTVTLDFGPEGIYLSAGVAIAISTQPIALTLIGADEAAVAARWL